MKQRTSGREKAPGRGFEVVLVPKENKARGCGEGPGHREIPEPAFPGAPDDGVPALDSDWAPLGLILRWVNSTLASVTPRQSQGLSGSCHAKTASEDPVHPFSLGIKQAWNLHLTDEEQHLRAGGRTLDSSKWESASLGPLGMRTL